MEKGEHILHFQSTGLMEGKTQTRWCHVVLCACQPSANRADQPTQRTPPSEETPPGREGLSQKPGDPLRLLSPTLVHMPQATAVNTANQGAASPQAEPQLHYLGSSL